MVNTCFLQIPDYLPGTGDPIPHYAELKTCKALHTPRDISLFESRKLLRVWAQCFLLGVPKAIYGFKDNNLFVSGLQELDVQKIPKMVIQSSARRGQKPPWDGTVCIVWLHAALKFICANVEEGKEYSIRYSRQSQHISIMEQQPQKEYSYLTHQFVQHKLGEKVVLEGVN